MQTQGAHRLLAGSLGRLSPPGGCAFLGRPESLGGFEGLRWEGPGGASGRAWSPGEHGLELLFTGESPSGIAFGWGTARPQPVTRPVITPMGWSEAGFWAAVASSPLMAVIGS